MATIALTSGAYEPIPEGTTIFRIDNVDYKEKFGKMSVRMVTEDGKVHNNNFNLLDARTHQPSQGALSAFSFFAKCVMNDFNLAEVDPVNLIGHYVQADVTHDVKPSTKDPSKNVTFIRLENQKPAAGFGFHELEPEPEESSDEYDLGSLLGD